MKHIGWNTLLILLVLGGLPPAALAEQPPRPQILLITGKAQTPDARYPDWEHRFHNEQIVETLEHLADIKVTEDLSVLNNNQLAQYDLIINNSLFRTPTESQLAAFYHFIGEGNAYLALHTGLATFLNSERYRPLIGGYFLGWDARKPLAVHTFDAWYGYDYNDQTRHPITRGIANFTLEDELFLMHTTTDDMEVIARAEHHPVLWLRHWEGGRVMGMTLGNGESEGQHPSYRNLLENSVRWLLEYPLLEPLPALRLPENADPVHDYADLTQIAHHPRESSALSYHITQNSAPEVVTPQIDDQGRLSVAVAAGQRGTARITIEARSPQGLTDSVDWQVLVEREGAGNLATYHGVTASTSSNEWRKFTSNPALVHDGNPQTRWSSSYQDDSWIQVDLGQAQRIAQVRLTWEAAYGRAFQIKVSEDGTNWETVFTETEGDGGEDRIRFTPVTARYVRLQGQERATQWGYSLYEFEVFGPTSQQ